MCRAPPKRANPPKGGGAKPRGYREMSSRHVRLAAEEDVMRSFLSGHRSPAVTLTLVLLMTGCSDSGFRNSTTPVLHFGSPSEEMSVEVWVTTADGRMLLERRPSLQFSPKNDKTGVPTILVDESTVFQRMVGFGAAITGSSAWLIHRGLAAGQRERLMRQLFDPHEGIGLSFVRTTVGASDFSLSNYTYDDVRPGETDPGLHHFSINPDRAAVLPIVKRATAINPALRVMASPWSAPAWMKENAGLNGGELLSGLYSVYARYLRRYVEAYAAAGVPLYAITVQNEPHHEAAYPSMRMRAHEQADFIANHLGPVFDQAGIQTKILAWDGNWKNTAYALRLLGNAAVRRYVAGIAFHCYAGDVSAQTKVHNAYPKKGIYFTECSGGAWSTDFGDNLIWNLRHLIIGATRNWAKSVLLWNIALNPEHGPKNGGCHNCRGVVTVDPSAGTVEYNVEYYALGHASKFVMPGAYRIASTSTGDSGLEHVAFRNPDGSKVLIVLNATAEGTEVEVRSRQRSFFYRMPARAVATLRWEGE